MKKSLFALLFAGALCLALSGCDLTPTADAPSPSPTAQATPSPTPAPTPEPTPSPEPTPPSQALTDVDDDTPDAAAIRLCVDEGLMELREDGRFEPEAALSYGEMRRAFTHLLDVPSGGTFDEVWFGQSYDEASISRFAFCVILAEHVGELEAINTIEKVPDEEYLDILTLYNAGVVTPVDDYGTFDRDTDLSRGDAAAILARVLDPSLRVKFSLAPLPTDGYTLTYLMDAPWNAVDAALLYPVCFLPGKGLLTLEGKFVPMDRAVISMGFGTWGPYGHLTPWASQEVYDAGFEFQMTEALIDIDGNWIAPLDRYHYLDSVEGGFLAASLILDGADKGGYHWYLLDETGREVGDLGVTEGGNVLPEGAPKRRSLPDVEPYMGITPHGPCASTRSPYYISTDRVAVSQKFLWCGPLGPDGKGFVGLNNKIYRIEFNAPEDEA